MMSSPPRSRKAPLVDVGVGRFPALYKRQPGRPSPYNLFSETGPMYASAPDDEDAAGTAVQLPGGG